MTKNVLLLGLKATVIDDAFEQLQMPGVEFFVGTGLDGLRDTLAHHRIDHVIMGAGLGLDTRLEIVQEIFRVNDTATVHMKDYASGSRNFVAFVRAILAGLDTFHPEPSLAR